LLQIRKNDNRCNDEDIIVILNLRGVGYKAFKKKYKEVIYNDVCVSGALIHLFFRFPSNIFVINKKRNIRGVIEDYHLQYLVANYNLLINVAKEIRKVRIIKCL
jgi:hypothetical protein